MYITFLKNLYVHYKEHINKSKLCKKNKRAFKLLLNVTPLDMFFIKN